MRATWPIGALALAFAFASGCSTQGPSANFQDSATSSAPAPLSYREASDQLIAATLTSGDHQSTSMEESGPCAFTFFISPGGQSTLGFSFDVRELDLSVVSPAEGQARHSAFSRRIACAEVHGLCASFTGMPVNFIEIASGTPEGLDGALGGLRDLQAICRASPPAGG